MPTIVHLNVSPGGIPKRPIAEAYLTPTGLEGDAHAHPEVHGGPLKAILLMTAEGLDELRAQGFSIYPGALGENFTTSGLDRRQIRVGDRYQAGQSLIEVTRLRSPCSTLDLFNDPGLPRIQDAMFDPEVKAGDSSSPRWGLSGFYARVVEPGLVRTGDRITLVDTLA